MSGRIAYDDAVRALVDAVPEFEPAARDLEQFHGEVLPHVIFGEAAQFAEESIARGQDNVVQRLFDVIETLAVDGDLQTQELVQMSFIENLGKSGASKDQLVELMQPAARRLFDEIESFWGA